MLRFESHVFVLCTVLTLLTLTLAGEKEHKKFIEKYNSLMKNLKGKQTSVQTGTKPSCSEKNVNFVKAMAEVLYCHNFFMVYVSKESIFNDSYAQIMNAKAADMLQTHFFKKFDTNEPSSPGKHQNWLYILSKEIFNPSRKLFKNVDPNNINGQLEINENSRNDEDLQHFEFIGRVFGLALFYEERVRGVNLTPSFYQRILNENIKTENVEKQMSAFIKGLTDLIPLDELRKFNEKELELLLCDIENIDYDQWKENTSYESDYKNEKPVEWFWEIIKEYNESERRKILLFATGTDALPVYGFMNDLFPFKIKKKLRTHRLAEQHIRSDKGAKVILIPPYETKKELIDAMNRIVAKNIDKKIN